MAEKLQSLLDKINEKGVKEAEATAAGIIAEAKKEAEAIRAKAKADAEAAVRQAEEQAEGGSPPGRARHHPRAPAGA